MMLGVQTAFSQKHHELFKTVPPIEADTPEWAILMYSADPNVYEVEKLYQEYYSNRVFQKSTHSQNYKKWRKDLADNNWVSPNGKFNIPSFEEEQEQKAIWERQWQESQNNPSRAATWQPLGPFETRDRNSNAWISSQVNVYTIDQSLSDPNIVYCGTESGGVFRSSNKGTSWTNIGNALNLGGVTTVKVHPTAPNTVYIGQGHNVYRSTDAGANWTTVFTRNNFNATDILFVPAAGANPQIVLIAGTGSGGGLIRSTDSGTNWTSISTSRCWDLELKPGSADTVYLLQTNVAAQHVRFYRSTDKGVTFTEQNNGWFAGSSTGINNSNNGARMTVTPANPNYIYVALLGNDVSAAQDINWIGVYKSVDAGSTWTLPAGDPGGPYSANHLCISGFSPTLSWGGTYNQGYYNLGIAASHTNAEHFMVGCLNLFRSEDGAQTYIPMGGYTPGVSGYSHPDIQEIDINGSDVWVSTDGGVDLYSADWTSKVSLNNGINNADYWGFDSGWNEDVLVGGRYHNGNAVLYQNYPAGKSISLGGGETPTGFVHPGNPRQVYHSDIGGRLIPTSLTGTVINISNLQTYPNQHIVAPDRTGEFTPDPRCYNHLYVSIRNEIRKSTDGGTTFVLLNAFGNDVNDLTTGIEVSRSNPQVIYVAQRDRNATNNGWLESKLWKTSDGGTTWSEVNLPTTNNNGGFQISLSPTNENELYLAINNGGTNNNKIFKTTDSGANWTNWTTATLNNHGPRQIYVQGGTNGGVYYASTTSVFYRNNTHSDWQIFNQGLPMGMNIRIMKPFYRDGLLRIATHKGIWSSPFEETSTPIAQPTVDKLSACPQDTFNFDDYSMLNHTSATWAWNITPAPAYISSTSVRNPKVVFGNVGNYNVSLTVTNPSGTDTKTVNNMIEILSACTPDTLAGRVIDLPGTATNRFAIPQLNLNSNTVTISGWFKPDTTFTETKGLVFCRQGTTVSGLRVKANNQLVYEWNGANYNWNSGAFLPEKQWSHVALVIEPTKATIYLNGIPHVHNTAQSADEFNGITYIGHDPFRTNWYFDGKIDEVGIWNRALTQQEIRTSMHLTKEDIVPTDNNLQAYYQFNEMNGQTFDKSGNGNHATMEGMVPRITSTAPIGGGTAQLINLTGTTTTYNFTQAGTKIKLSNSCGPVNGDMVVTRLNVAPDVNPTANPSPANCWIVNGFEAAANLAPVDSIEFTPGLTTFTTGLAGNANNAVVHTRSFNAEGSTWNSKTRATHLNANTLRFGRNVNMTGSRQFALSNNAPAFTEVTAMNPCQADTIAGRAIVVNGNNSNYAQLPAMNLNTNTYTLSAWINPASATQNNGAGIIFCRGGSTTAGMHMSGSAELRYHWNNQNWGWASGATPPANEWSHVALVIEPTRATIYLNGVPYVHNTNLTSEEFNAPLRIGSDPTNGAFNGQIDEVCIWNRALTQNEIRELRHLTKDKIVATDAELRAYIQFNEANGTSFDKSGKGNHAVIIGAPGIVNSTAAVGGGVSHRQQVTAGGVVNFGNTGVKMGFSNVAGSTYPNGELCVSRINVAPDTNPTAGNLAGNNTYWIVNNYGTNSTFTVLDSLVLENVNGIFPIHNSNHAQFNIYRRGSNAFGATWGTALDVADLVQGNPNGNGKITFSTANGITGFSQFAISDGRGVQVNLKAFLEGPYANNMMSDDLRSNGHLPINEPFGALNYMHQNGGGGESCAPSVFTATGNDAITDWVTVELRDKNTPATILYTQSALLQRDGNVVGMDGTSLLQIRNAPADDYYVALRHRNHLGVMTAAATTLNSTAPSLIDFTLPGTPTYTLGASATKNVNGVMVLYSGDASFDGFVSAGDQNLHWRPQNGGTYNYATSTGDFNMNAFVSASDLNLFWRPNNSVTQQLPQ